MPPLALAAPAAVQAEGQRSRQTIAVIAVLAAMALVVLDAAMVTVAVPTIAQELSVAPAAALRIVSVYQTALVMALLPVAALGESLGYRRVFLGGVALFGVSATCAASASSLDQLIAARFLQGLGGAAIMALGIALLRQALPAQRIGAAIGWNAMTVALCAAAGPALGAVVISVASWPYLFLLHLPLSLVAVAAGAQMPATRGSARAPDLVSMTLCAAGFAFLMFGAQAAMDRPALAALLVAASAAAFWAVTRRESPKFAPMVPVDLLRIRAVRLSVVASVCCFTGQAACMLVLPFHLQHGLGQTPLMTGLYMTSWPLAVAVAALAAGRIADRMPAWMLCTSGAGLIAAGLAGAALLPLAAGPAWLAALLIPCGLGFGLFQVPNNRTMFLSAPIARSGAAGGMQGTARLTGQTWGSVLITLLFAWTPSIAAPTWGLVLGALFALLAAIVSAMQATAPSEEKQIG